MRALLPASFLLAGLASILLSTPSADGAAFHRNSLSSIQSSVFGLGHTTPRTIAKLPRGGDDEKVEEVEENEVLYLPGLLDVEIKKTTQVRSTVNNADSGMNEIQEYFSSQDRLFLAAYRRFGCDCFDLCLKSKGTGATIG